MKEEESLSLVSALIAPTDCMVLSLGVSAELGEVWEEESAAGPGCCSGTGERDDMELGNEVLIISSDCILNPAMYTNGSH